MDFPLILISVLSKFFGIFVLFNPNSNPKRLIENVPEIKANLENIYFGTIDTWVVWNLTNHYATDVSNASRTFLLNL